MKRSMTELARAYRRPLAVGTAVVLLALPLVMTNQYLVRIAIMVGIYVVLAESLNIIIGFTGMFSLGHGAFYGIGAYASAIAAVRFGLPFWLAMPFAGVFTALIGAFLGLATLRLRQTFLVFGTLAFGEIVRILIMNWNSLTRGPMGIPGIPIPSIFGFEFGSFTSYYYLVLLFSVVSVWLIARLYRSRVGRAFIAIREDETGASSMGVNVFGYKVLAFTLACFFAGLAGSFYAHFVTYISADQFAVTESFLILTMVALGGTGSIIGPIVGAVLLMLVPEAFRFLNEFRYVLYGLILIVVMVWKPEGIAGEKGIFMRAAGGFSFGGGRKKKAGEVA